MPGRPEDQIPSIPRDLTSLSDDELMVLFSTYVAWQNYIAVKATEAEVDEATAETEMRVADALGLVEVWTGDKADRVTVAKAERELDPVVRRARDTYAEAKARRKMLATLVGNMERAAAVVSRELSRRIGRTDIERRHARLTP